MSLNNFILSSRFHYRRHFLFWSVYFVYSVCIYFHPWLDILGFWKWILLEVMEVLLNLLLQIPFCYVIIYFLLPKYLMKKRYFVFTIMFFVLFGLAYVIYVFNDYFLVQQIHHLFGQSYPNTQVF